MAMEGVWEKERQETATGDNNQAQPISKHHAQQPISSGLRALELAEATRGRLGRQCNFLPNKPLCHLYRIHRSGFSYRIICIENTDSSEWFLQQFLHAWFTLQFPLVVLDVGCIKGMMWVGEGSVQWEQEGHMKGSGVLDLKAVVEIKPNDELTLGLDAQWDVV